MSTASVTKVPHKHAEVIHAFADGAQIEARDQGGEWELAGPMPCWHTHRQYRVKPEPPAKVHPVTRMTGEELCSVYNSHDGGVDTSLVATANAALRHAIDAKQIISLVDHQAEMIAFGVKLRDAARGRDMAVAEAVREACFQVACRNIASSAARDTENLDLAAVIAGVPC